MVCSLVCCIFCYKSCVNAFCAVHTVQFGTKSMMRDETPDSMRENLKTLRAEIQSDLLSDSQVERPFMTSEQGLLWYT